MADRPSPFEQGTGVDPARMTQTQETVRYRVELPPIAYAPNGKLIPTSLPGRPGLNQSGKAIQIRVNQFKVLDWPEKAVHQYDVHIGKGDEKVGLRRLAWESKAVQSMLNQVAPLWLYDGNKLAWCTAQPKRDEVRILVDFDKEKGREPRKDRDGNPKPNQTYVRIRHTGTINMAVVRGYLNRQMDFDNSVIEAITFLDHVMREKPSRVFNMIKRSFFQKGPGDRTSLDEVVEAMKGVYSSIRLCEPKGSMGNGTGLAVNVDVANGTFWIAQCVAQAARNHCKVRGFIPTYLDFAKALRPVLDHKSGKFLMSQTFKELRRMAKLKFHVRHRGKEGESKTYTIDSFVFGEQYGPEGGNAKQVFFEVTGSDGSVRRLNIFEYFVEKYNARLEYWYLPLIKTTKDGYFPMEVCTLLPNQRYKFKLNADQTSKMIRFAVTRPKERLAAVHHGVRMLNWAGDEYLKHYGLKIDPNLTVTNAKLLQNPEVQFTGGKVNPGTSGRWDLRGKKFIMKAPDLKSWGIAAVNACVDEATIRNFLRAFIQTYQSHGGVVVNRDPVIYIPPKNQDINDLVVDLRTKTGNQVKMEPQILLYVLPGRDSFMYERLKKNNECRWGHVSQCLSLSHVTKAQPQYCSNVCMKFNAKLGGATSRIAGRTPTASAEFLKVPTMIIGADVSHASPGSQQASMAAVTMSLDAQAMRYAAAVQTNGHRVEMITRANIESMLMPLFKKWCQTHNTSPQNIIYFRDGVSEGQYLHVLENEVRDFKDCLKAEFPGRVENIKFTVVVASKRHHLRFFPKEGDTAAADSNNNALPGTLVERDITHPFEYDFYLASHSAIQGTARPTHYYVLMDEHKHSVENLQNMIYQHCYQYMRSTTPVSLYPAIYYAHLASNRAKAHDDTPATSGPQSGQKFVEAYQLKIIRDAARAQMGKPPSTTSTVMSTEAKPLVPFAIANPKNKALMDFSMWYI